MKAGDAVTVIDFEGKRLKRILVALEDNVAFVCKSDEFEDAGRKNREPICMGFMLDDLVRDET
jgi:hypothetical protein